ncbi:glycosyltransferase family 1 protein [Streptococcus suis]
MSYSKGVPRILYVSGGTIDNGGISTYMRNYYRNIDKSKLQIDFLVHGEKSVHDDEIISQGGMIYYAPIKRDNPIENTKIVTKILKSGKYSVVHAHMDGMNGLFLRQAKNCGIPIRISHSHNTDFLTSNLLKLLLHKFSRLLIGRYATDLWACSEEAGRWLYGKNQFQLVRNAITIKNFEFSAATRQRIRKEFDFEGKFVIGHIGKLSYQKNQSFLIDIFDKFQKINEDSILVLVGEGEDKLLLQEKANRLGLSSKVFFLGERDNVSDLLNAFDVFVFPSRFEGLGIVAIEAQTNGLYCICSTKVPKEVNITGNVIFHNLEESVDEWVDSIRNISTRDVNSKEKVFNAGYDIEFAARELEKKYLELVEK